MYKRRIFWFSYTMHVSRSLRLGMVLFIFLKYVFFLPFFGFVSGLFLFRCLGIHAVWALGTWPGFGFGFGLSGLDYHNWRNDKMEWDDYYHQCSSSRHHLRGEYRHSVHMKHYNNTMFIQTLTFSSFTNPHRL